MASALSQFPSPLTSPIHHHRRRRLPIITCGPRDNRGPLLRGRTLSTEAILAVQSLKRAHRLNPTPAPALTPLLSRLLKADLLAALAELQRQDRHLLALAVFSFARREPWYASPDFALYADMASALARSNSLIEIDTLVSELVQEVRESGGLRNSINDVRGIVRLVKVLILAGRGEAVRELYGAVSVGDEYWFKVVSRGLRRLGEAAAAEEVERDYEMWLDGGVGSARPETLRNQKCSVCNGHRVTFKKSALHQVYGNCNIPQCLV